MTTTTTCPEHRRVGYAYRWNSATRSSTLACKGCGLGPDQHETIAQTIARLTVGNINLTPEGK